MSKEKFAPAPARGVAVQFIYGISFCIYCVYIQLVKSDCVYIGLCFCEESVCLVKHCTIFVHFMRECMESFILKLPIELE